MADEENGEKPKCTDGETVHVGPDLGGIRPILHHRADHTLVAGMARVVDPKDIPPDATRHLHLAHREGNLFDVLKSGPSQVSTPAYRSGWDNIFGKKAPVGQA